MRTNFNKPYFCEPALVKEDRMILIWVVIIGMGDGVDYGHL
jgi:hypothetical protein